MKQIPPSHSFVSAGLKPAPQMGDTSDFFSMEISTKRKWVSFERIRFETPWSLGDFISKNGLWLLKNPRIF